MCGIAGVLRLDGAPVDCEDIKAMTDAIAHRGPDGEGQWCEGNIGLGHRRLAIIDLSADAAQPMHSADGRYVITYNGEVYNFRELRRDLEKSGSRFRSYSDTEVVLEAVARWGLDEAVRRFNGMFAFAIWDLQEKRLLLSRDRYGIKPLYIWNSPNQIAFASEPKAFRSLPGFVALPDAHGIAEYLTFQNILSERTFTKNVSVFPPGHWGEFDLEAGVLSTRQYWDFHFEEPATASSEADYAEELRRLLGQAVDRQLVSDVEVGAYLSGGLDSGSIVALAARRLPLLKTFTVGFEMDDVHSDERHFDERGAAEDISAFVGSTQFEAIIGARHVSRCLPELVRSMEEPRVGQSYPNYYAAALASRFVKVVLAGTGGDEVLGGYPWRYPLNAKSSSDSWHYKVWNRVLSEGEVRELLAPVANELSDFDSRSLHRTIYGESPTVETEGNPSATLRALYFEAKTFLHGLLAVEDRLGMAHGIETRFPFLDNDLVDFAMKLPQHVRFVGIDTSPPGNGGGKQLLRRLACDLLPPGRAEAGKQGFSAPDSLWLLEPLMEEAGRFAHRDSRNVFDPRVVQRLATRAAEGGQSRLLSWSLLMAIQSIPQE